MNFVMTRKKSITGIVGLVKSFLKRRIGSSIQQTYLRKGSARQVISVAKVHQ